MLVLDCLIELCKYPSTFQLQLNFEILVYTLSRFQNCHITMQLVFYHLQYQTISVYIKNNFLRLMYAQIIVASRHQFPTTLLITMSVMIMMTCYLPTFLQYITLKIILIINLFLTIRIFNKEMVFCFLYTFISTIHFLKLLNKKNQYQHFY